ESIATGDRVLLVVESDLDQARQAMAAGRERGFRVVVATGREGGQLLAQDLKPDAILLDAELDAEDGIALLDHIKHQPPTRYVPVHVLAPAAQRHAALVAGAAGVVEKPVSPEALDDALGRIGHLLSQEVKRVLVVEDDEPERTAIAHPLVGS